MEDNRPGIHAVNRKYSLDIFKAEIAFAPLGSVIRYSADGLPRPIRGILKAAGITRPARQTIEAQFGFNQAICNSEGGGYYSGLWQSIRYFSDVESDIRQDLQFRYSIPAVSTDLMRQIQIENSVCLHVRRTDYVTHNASNSLLGFVGVNYYRAAIEQLESQTQCNRYFIFSDDLEWCRTELSFVPNATYVGNEHVGYKDGGHLQLMSLCTHFIIPNSTFSWWAAWLSTKAEKVVIVPDSWFRDPGMDASGLYPATWIKVPVNQ
ncbi:MAG: alpha-1,2-fucosyltransferase [Planctomycetaceae bacterium]